jgi:hypothetical protein
MAMIAYRCSRHFQNTNATFATAGLASPLTAFKRAVQVPPLYLNLITCVCTANAAHSGCSFKHNVHP